MLNLGFCFFVFGTRQKRSLLARCLGGTTLVLLGTLTPTCNTTAREARALDVVIVILLDSLSLSLFFLFYQNVLHARALRTKEREREIASERGWSFLRKGSDYSYADLIV